MPGSSEGLPDEGRLGSFATLTGFGCMAGLLVIMLGLLGSGSWGLAHNRPVIAIVGVTCLWLAPVWLISAVAASIIRRDRPLSRKDIVLMLGVLLCAALSLAPLGR